MTVSATTGPPVRVPRPRAGGRGRRRVLIVLACTAVVLGLVATPSGAITGGQLDESRHPYVGGTVLYYAPLDETIVNCTGSLISATVFLTAAHCGRHDTARSVSFDEVFDPATSQRHHGRFYAHPAYDPAQPYHNDVAVIVLDEPVPDVDPTKLPRLPEAGLLDRMKADGSLNQSTQFTSVGYGFLGYTTEPGGLTRVRGQVRHYAVGSFNALAPDQLHISQNQALDDGGTCNGDSGGPNFLGAGEQETLVIAGLTSTGDTYCKATNVTYRVDTESARTFLGQYVPLP
ncbi:MAG: trypsin-like serine protease [Actinobacteria bacterium]|nr:trypsin-like serine protease [Actinomycetota bacterium]